MQRLVHRLKATYEPSFHIEMLLDSMRVEAYAKTIEQVMKPGDVVVDAGTGSGILAIYAAMVGAARVYAIEIDEQLANIADENISQFGFQDQICVLRGDATQMDLPEQVDVLMAEMLHGWLVEEAQAPAFLNLKRFVKPGGSYIPLVTENFATLATIQPLAQNHPLLSPIHVWEVDQIDIRDISDTVMVNRVELQKMETLHVSETTTFRVSKDGVANVVALNSRAELADNYWLGMTTTLFPTIIYPLPAPIRLYMNQNISFRFRYELGCRWTEIEVTIV